MFLRVARRSHTSMFQYLILATSWALQSGCIIKNQLKVRDIGSSHLIVAEQRIDLLSWTLSYVDKAFVPVRVDVTVLTKEDCPDALVS